MLTRKEFDDLNSFAYEGMSKNLGLQKKAIEVLKEADKHRWIHGTKFMGLPSLNPAEDVLALGEVIWKSRPEYIVELGTAWGGTTAFFAKMLEGGKIIGIDLYVPDHVRWPLSLFKNVLLIEGDTVDPDVVEQVYSICKGRVMVFVDSDHTHDHVLRELELYSPLVKDGQYLIVSDTIIEKIDSSRQRPWSIGNNPKTALDEFLKQNERFEVDRELENKLLMTLNRGGWLRARV